MKRKNLADDLRAFFVAIGKDIWKDWYALTSAIVAVITAVVGVFPWIFGKPVVPMPIEAHWLFLGVAPLALLVTCFLVWRRERTSNNSRKAYWHLTRLIEEGDRQRAAFDSSATKDGAFVATITGPPGLPAWYGETLAVLKKEYSDYWQEFFSDLGEFGANGLERASEQAATLLQRLRELRDSLRPTKE